MGPEEAMEVAQLIDAKKVVLIHTNTDDGFAFDINQVNKFTLKNKKVMQPGDILRFKNA
ncbi:unknown [Clostridium sp. CAG:288]|nr:unknown [Clostridium sp. CAG:288]